MTKEYELLKMMEQLDEGIEPPNVDWDKVKSELHEKFQNLNESLTVASSNCPTCGRPL